MSTELETMLRHAAAGLPEPGLEVTERARLAALSAAAPKRRLRRRLALALAAALAALTALGGSLVVPGSGTADEPFGLGFVQGPGWNVMHDDGDGTPFRPAVSIAANVPFSPEDDAEGLPLSTLMSLPPDGIVMVAIFTARGEEMHDSIFHRRRLPLRASEAKPYGVWIRPGRPLGQVRLWAGVNRHNVDLTIYYGSEHPPAGLIAAAQRQLDRLIVRTKLPDLTRSSWRGTPPFEEPR